MRNVAIAFATVLALISGGSAALASGRDVIQDCTDDEVLAKTYTQQEYRDALAKLPADADQYGNCRDIIARAQEAAATKGASTKHDDGTSSGAATPPSGGSGPAATPASSKPAAEQLAAATPDDRAAAEAAAKDPALPEVSATGVGAAPEKSSSDLPAPMLVLLALLLAGALALAAVRVRSLVDARRA
jgi:hypothetical protein